MNIKQEFQIGEKVYMILHNNVEEQTIKGLELNEYNKIEYITNKDYIFIKGDIGQEVFRDKEEASSHIDNSKLWVSNDREKHLLCV